MISIVRSIYSQSVHAPARDDNGAERYCPANNGEPFRFRIGSVKSAQLFQLSAENFFRLRYESVPLQ